MTRDFFINGPTIVKVRGGRHLETDSPATSLCFPTELGLSQGPVRVEPRFYHRDVTPDDFGRNAPAETLWDLADARVHMTLVHYDWYALEVCMMQAMAGGAVVFGDSGTNIPNRSGVAGTLFPFSRNAGAFAAGGRLMGGGLPMFASGNYYMSLNIGSAVNQNRERQEDDRPWRFRACYLAEQPFAYPLGALHTAVDLVWRVVPYAPIWVSGTVQADNQNDAPAYSLPPGTAQLSGGVVRTRNIDVSPGAADGSLFYLTGEILSSGVTLWDRVEDE